MKKRYVLHSDGEQHQAVIAHEGPRVAVAINDTEPVEIDAKVVMSGRALSLRIGARMHLIHLSGTDNKGGVAATVRGRPVSMSILDELHALALKSLGTAAGSGTVMTDIPGLVVEIKVKPGQKVHQGEPVIVVEAMKMQNELVAAVSGTVAEVVVAVDQTVNPGDPLVIIDPEPGG
jgi:biotin carboxyl carrier protein